MDNKQPEKSKTDMLIYGDKWIGMETIIAAATWLVIEHDNNLRYRRPLKNLSMNITAISTVMSTYSRLYGHTVSRHAMFDWRKLRLGKTEMADLD